MGQQPGLNQDVYFEFQTNLTFGISAGFIQFDIIGAVSCLYNNKNLLKKDLTMFLNICAKQAFSPKKKRLFQARPVLFRSIYKPESEPIRFKPKVRMISTKLRNKMKTMAT